MGPPRWEPLVQAPLHNGASCRCQSTIFPTGLCSQGLGGCGTFDMRGTGRRWKSKGQRHSFSPEFAVCKMSSIFPMCFLTLEGRPSFAFPSASHWPEPGWGLLPWTESWNGKYCHWACHCPAEFGSCCWGRRWWWRLDEQLVGSTVL